MRARFPEICTVLVVLFAALAVLFDALFKWCGLAALAVALLSIVVPSSVWVKHD